jgi:hypothetical protein
MSQVELEQEVIAGLELQRLPSGVEVLALSPENREYRRRRAVQAPTAALVQEHRRFRELQDANPNLK